MPRMSEMFPSRWLSASDLNDRDTTLTIASIKEEDIGQGDQREQKWVVHFYETEKSLVLNKTNAVSLEECFGDDTDNWINQRVVLYPTKVTFQGRQVAAIRVKENVTRGILKSKAKSVVLGHPHAKRSEEPHEDVPF